MNTLQYMRIIFGLVISLLLFSCSSTKHTIIPYNGFAFKTNERILVRMVNDRYNYDSELSLQVLDKLRGCKATFSSWTCNKKLDK